MFWLFLLKTFYSNVKVVLNLKQGDIIHTEISRKISLETMDTFADAAGFERRRMWVQGDKA